MIKKSLAKRILSGITSVLLSVSYVLPSVPLTGANAAGPLTSAGGNVSETSDYVTLLVGQGSELAGADVAQTIANASKEYAIGIASQFCVFLQEDFADEGCDLEGRAAVGGSINAGKKDLFEIGNGDYSDQIALDNLLGVTGYAHVIANGTIQNLASGVSKQYYDKAVSEGGNPVDVIKRYVTGPNGSIDYSTIKADAAIPPGENYTTYELDEELINFSADDGVFSELIDRSEKLSKKSTEDTQLLFTASKNLIFENGSWINDYESAVPAANAESFSADYWKSAAHLVYTGEDAEVIYFNLSEADFNAIVSKASALSFEGIPENAYIVINVAGKDVDLGFDYRFYYLNGKQISSGSGSFNGEDFDNSKVGNGEGNNDKRCSRFLYNLYEATTFGIHNNFAGTILAPNADVSGSGQGHLSGALIAKSFSGNFEFGYRPYTGPYSILGVESDYTISVEKLDEAANFLSGAKIGIYDTEGALVTSFVSGTDASVVDISAGKYVMKEIEAPVGYGVSDTEYYFEVTETKGMLAENGDISYVIEVALNRYDSKDNLISGASPASSAVFSPLDITKNVYKSGKDTFEFSMSSGVLSVKKNGTEITDTAELAKFVSYQPEGLGENCYVILHDNSVISTVIDLCDGVPFSITDKNAVTFRKVDKDDKLLKGADIVLKAGKVTSARSGWTTNVSFTADDSISTESMGWNWNTGVSASAALNIDSISEVTGSSAMWNSTFNNIYLIHEVAAPGGEYALADDIMFFVLNGTIYYKSVLDSSNLGTFPLMIGGMGGGVSLNPYGGAADWNTIDLSTASAAERQISMVNYEVSGAKITLKKVNFADHTQNVKGAEIELWGGTVPELIYTWTDFQGTEDLFNSEFKNDAKVKQYSTAGYLNEGEYYLVEKTAPAGYSDELVDTKMYFTVDAAGNVYSGRKIVSSETLTIANAVNKTASARMIAINFFPIIDLRLINLCF